jgi:hypothetical protein
MTTIAESSGTITFDEALRLETVTLQAQHPVLADALGRAASLVLDGKVFPEENGTTAMVQSSDGHTWYYVNGHCPCKASTYREEPCYHRLSWRLYQRTVERLLADQERWTVDLDGEVLDAKPGASGTVPPQHLCEIQGKQYVKYAGLLQMAHERGLVSLTADWTANEPELSLAHAVATFQDGKRFEESGDASPANTNRKVAVHFRRVALTRAKARCLRDALGVQLVAVEELSDGD